MLEPLFKRAIGVEKTHYGAAITLYFGDMSKLNAMDPPYNNSKLGPEIVLRIDEKDYRKLKGQSA